MYNSLVPDNTIVENCVGKLVCSLKMTGRILAPNRRVLFAVSTMVALLLTTRSEAQFNPHAVKAAAIFNMGKFISWPKGTDFTHGHTICIPRKSPLKPILQSQSKRRIRGRKIRLEEFTLDDLENFLTSKQCHVFYIPKCEEDCSKIITASKKLPMVTVSDEKSTTMFHFVEEESRVRLSIDMENTEDAVVEFSPQFMLLVKGHYHKSAQQD